MDYQPIYVTELTNYMFFVIKIILIHMGNEFDDPDKGIA